MPIFIKDSGIWKPATPFGKDVGFDYPETKIGWVNNEGVWQKFYQKEVSVTLSNSTNVTLKSLFTSDVWNDAAILKRVIVPNGVTIGATANTHAIIPSPTADGNAGAWAGDLTLEIQSGGIVWGRGGAANSGTGGHAIWGNVTGQTGQYLKVRNAGQVLGGGGGGGRGGQGGPGTYTETTAYQYSRSAPYYYWRQYSRVVWLYWAAPPGSLTYGFEVTSSTQTTYTAGGWTYQRGTTSMDNDSGNHFYQVRRTRTLNSTGGTGGNGGRGQGSDGNANTGSAGSAGGTNAGSGGGGGNGAAAGNVGSTGSTGASGNAGAGSLGVTGGLAGYYKYGYLDFVNTGIVQGRSA